MRFSPFLILLLFLSGLSKGQESSPIQGAFFGLDNDLPRRANLLCKGAKGLDGMPLNFLYPIADSSLWANDFVVIDKQGNSHVPHCAVLAPADELGENRTVLLIGEFGQSPSNPPVEVRVVGDLWTLPQSEEESAPSKVINLKGQLTNKIIPLSSGPSIFFVQRISGSISECGNEFQCIQVVWSGGVRPFLKKDEEADLVKYYTGYYSVGDSLIAVKPRYIRDIEDNDNFHQLCFEGNKAIEMIRIEPEVVMDPNDDPNPACEISLKEDLKLD